MARYLYSELAGRVQARLSCQKGGNLEWFEKHTETIKLLTDLLPHGSGFDSGTKIDLDVSHADKLVFYTSYHHMNDAGYYDGWTEHTVTVTPSLQFKFNLRISGHNRNEVKDHIHESFDYALRREVTYELFRPLFPDLAVTSKWENEDGTPSQCYQAWYVPSRVRCNACLDVPGKDGLGRVCNSCTGTGEVNGHVRFWNNPDGAMKHAADLMEKKFFNRGAQ